MPQARKRLVSTEVTPFYQVTSRCVRRQRVCGRDPLTGKDYSARKQEIQKRLRNRRRKEGLDQRTASSNPPTPGNAPEQYFAFIKKPGFGFGFAHTIGALDKLKECAEHFEKGSPEGPDRSGSVVLTWPLAGDSNSL